MKKRIIIVLATMLAAALAAVGIGAVALTNYALSSKHRQRTTEYGSIVKKYPELRSWIDSLQNADALRDTFVYMPDGLRAHALFVRSPHADAHTALMVHGYGNQCTDMLHIAHIYSAYLHYNVLLPDLHGHGASDGDDIRMGWLDRKDILHWIDIAPEIFHMPADSMCMVVHGISMGAATTMCVSGENTPHYVKCFVEDCGYTSAWDEFAHELHGRFGLPTFPMLHAASALTQLRYGWNFCEASPLKQVARCHKPMLFIHGDNDTFVPTSMVHPLYNAKPQPKQLWIAPGSAHANSYKDHKQEYIKRVTDFVKKYTIVVP